MILRALNTGIISGILLTIASMYPVVSLVAPALIPRWDRPVESEIVHGLMLMISAAIFVPTLFGFGAIAAWRARARTLLEGIGRGALAGGAVGLVFFAGIIAPLTAVTAAAQLMAAHTPTREAILPPEAAIITYTESMTINIDIMLSLTIGVALLIGAISGAIIGHRQRNTLPPERPTLYDHLAAGNHPRTWFINHDTPLGIGLTVGTILGVIFAVATAGNIFVYDTPFPELAEILQNTMPGMLFTGSAWRALNALAPIGAIGLLGLGGFVIGFIKNPPNRFTTRISSVVLAANAMFAPALTAQMYILYFHIGLAPYVLLRFSLTPEFITDVAEGEFGFDQLVIIFNAIAQNPGGTLIGLFVVPWIAFFTLAIVMTIYGLLQGVAYSLFIPIIHKTPVDVAAALRSKLNHAPNEILPLIYNLFGRYPNAYDILAHLTASLYKKSPRAAELTAAYHTMGTSTQAGTHAQMVNAIRQLIAEHVDWRWHADVGAIYHALDQVLQAQTLKQILTIEAIPNPETSSLPPLMVKAVRYVARAVSELAKVEKVEDLPTKLIFLENSLEAMYEAQRFITEDMVGDPSTCTSTPPEQPALITALSHWQSVLLSAIKRLKGRADVTFKLMNNQCPHSAQVLLVTQIANEGLNVAQQVKLQMLPGSDYQIIDEPNGLIEILPPGEARELNMLVAPNDGVRRLRVEWQLTYDDAVNHARQQSFADIVEFTEPDRPFQRVFPIPYVTGTPLKTDDVFVGREDVFEFIRENLIGAHQNNAIILHGQRRTGKTSVLYRLLDVMKDTHYGVLIDMQGKPARGEVDFLYSIADDIAFALEDHGIEIDLPARADFEEAPEFYFRSRFIRSLRPHLNGKNLLLMFDEFEELQRRVDDGHLQPEIFQFLRNLMQHDQQVDFIFSGTHKLEELSNEYWSVLFNIAVYKPITFLSRAEIQHLILAPVAQYHTEYDPLAIERIINVTAGHPYFTQLVLHEVMVYYNETERGYLTVVDIDHALERIVERGEAHFKYIWSEATPEERAVLQGMAELLVNAETVHSADLQDFLTGRGLTSPDNWERALITLESRDIITRRNSKSTLYRFKVDLVRLWIDRTRPAL